MEQNIQSSTLLVLTGAALMAAAAVAVPVAVLAGANYDVDVPGKDSAVQAIVPWALVVTFALVGVVAAVVGAVRGLRR